jgi:hypothetical protein
MIIPLVWRLSNNSKYFKYFRYSLQFYINLLERERERKKAEHNAETSATQSGT